MRLDKSRCVEWTRLGLPCPAALLDPPRRKIEDPEPDDQPVEQWEPQKQRTGKETGIDDFAIIGRKPGVDTRFRGVSQEEWEAILLEIAIEAAQKHIPPQVHVPVPKDVVRNVGSTDKQAIALGVAVSAAFLAVGMAYGPKGLANMPGALGNAVRGAGGFNTGGFGGMIFKAPTFRGAPGLRMVAGNFFDELAATAGGQPGEPGWSGTEG